MGTDLYKTILVIFVSFRILSLFIKIIVTHFLNILLLQISFTYIHILCFK